MTHMIMTIARVNCDRTVSSNVCEIYMCNYVLYVHVGEEDGKCEGIY